MSNERNLPEPERLALPAAEVAKLLGISERHLWALNSSGRIFRPLGASAHAGDGNCGEYRNDGNYDHHLKQTKTPAKLSLLR